MVINKKEVKEKSLIIFDCDGVLRSASWEGLFRAYISVIENIGKDHRNFFANLDEFKKWWSPDWKENNKILGIVDPEIAGKIFYGRYEPYISLFPWAPDTLKQLSRKYSLAMLTSASEKSVRSSLGETARHFSLITASDHVQKLKPDPEGINFILKNLNFLPPQTLMVGDMKADVWAAKNAGVKSGVVSWGLDAWEDLVELEPDYKFKKPGDLLFI